MSGCRSPSFFSPGSRLEVRSFEGIWNAAGVLEVDRHDREVLVHLDDQSSTGFDEWIPVDSPRLRAAQGDPEELPPPPKQRAFQVGDKILIPWEDGKDCAARVGALTADGHCSVRFDDDYYDQGLEIRKTAERAEAKRGEKRKRRSAVSTSSLDQPETEPAASKGELEALSDDEFVNCACGLPEEDGLMVQCELCLFWQHAHCYDLDEDKVPEKYVCHFCEQPRLQRASKKYYLDQDWLRSGALPTLSSDKHQEASAELKHLSDSISKLVMIKDFLHGVRVKLNAVSVESHPKLYLWEDKDASATTTKSEKVQLRQPDFDDLPLGTLMNIDLKWTMTDLDLLSKLLGAEGKLPHGTSGRPVPVDPAGCKLRLLQHIGESQKRASSILDSIEARTSGGIFDESHDDATLRMLWRSLALIRKLALEFS